jgi:stage III sporulation protein AD
MERVLQITGVCVVTAILAQLVKKQEGELALVLAAGTAAVAALSLAGPLGELTDFFRELIQETGLRAELFGPLFKTVGIALTVRVGGSLCRDAGESGLAAVIETAGAVCALLAGLPLLRAALTLLMELMNG